MLIGLSYKSWWESRMALHDSLKSLYKSKSLWRVVVGFEKKVGREFKLQLVSEFTTCSLQYCSPQGHGLGLKGPRGHGLKRPRGPEKKSWSWAVSLGPRLSLDKMILILKSCNFQDLQVQLFLLWNYWIVCCSFIGILSLCDTVWHCSSLEKVNTLKITKWTVVNLLI